MKNKKQLILYFIIIICLIMNVFIISQFNIKLSINKTNDDKIILKTSFSQINDINGEGTITNPYQISTEDHLLLFREMVNQGNTNINAILKNNITINNNVLNSDGELNEGNFKQWIPIGNIENRYQGTFDGNNYTISGLYAKDESSCYIGLFGSINQGIVKNVKITDSYFFGKQFVGGIAGENTGIVENCSSNCYITGTLEAIGGIVGGNFGNIKGCYNEGKVYGSTFISTEINSSGNSYDVTVYCQAIGGITGGNYGIIDNCYNIGNITGSSNIGGITGWNNGSIINSNNRGNINCNTIYTYAYAGGIAGYGSIISSITDCYNTGDVISNKHDVGGIIGFVESSSKNAITNCHNTGNISGYMYVGGIVGYNQVALQYCYNQGKISGNRYVGGIVGYNKAYKKTYGSLTSCYTIGNVIGNSSSLMDIGIVTGYNNQGKISNCYYLENIGSSLSNDTYSISKTLEQFTNGEVAYLLNSLSNVAIYKQTINEDQYPNFIGSKVYYNSEEDIYHNHIHQWKYLIEANKIIIKCEEDECSNNDGGCIIITEPSSLIYTGDIISPIINDTRILNDEATITYTALNNSKLTNGKPINVGEYQINVTVKDLTIFSKYNISPLSILNSDVNVQTLIFNGNYQKPYVMVKSNDNKYLKENIDYIIESNKQINASDNYTLQIKGIGNYTGEISKNWQIKPLDITEAIIILGEELIYNGDIQTQTIKSVKIKDLDVTYEITNNKQTNASDNYTLQIKGIGNYTGEISKNWQILKKDLIITATFQSILYGKTIQDDAYELEGLIENHCIDLKLIPTTNNITTSGKINVEVNDIVYNSISVINNYNIKTISSNLIIEPDLTNINNLNLENVKSSDYENINLVIQMMSTAEKENATDADIQKWDEIITNCNNLISKIEKISKKIKDLTDIITAYDIKKINSNDINDFKELTEQIKILIATNNITIQEKSELDDLKKLVNNLQNYIEEVIDENERLNNEVLKYKDNTSMSDKEELFNLLQAIEKQLSLSTLTNQEIINLNNNKAIIESEIQKLTLLNEKVLGIINIALRYNEKTISTNDKEILMNLINDIDTLMKNASLSNSEINELNKAKNNVNNLLILINNITNSINNINSQITEKLIINKDNYEMINNCLDTTNSLLLSPVLTINERIYLEEIQLKLKDYIIIIDVSQQALQSENIQKVININNQNVELNNKQDLLKAQNEINYLCTNYINNYTTVEKELIEQYLQNISASLSTIENVENVINDITKLSVNSSTKLIDEVEEKYKRLADYEKKLVNNITDNKLNNVLKIRKIIVYILLVLIFIILMILLLRCLFKRRKGRK